MDSLRKFGIVVAAYLVVLSSIGSVAIYVSDDFFNFHAPAFEVNVSVERTVVDNKVTAKYLNIWINSTSKKNSINRISVLLSKRVWSGDVHSPLNSKLFNYNYEEINNANYLILVRRINLNTMPSGSYDVTVNLYPSLDKMKIAPFRKSAILPNIDGRVQGLRVDLTNRAGPKLMGTIIDPDSLEFQIEVNCYKVIYGTRKYIVEQHNTTLENDKNIAILLNKIEDGKTYMVRLWLEEIDGYNHLSRNSYIMYFNTTVPEPEVEEDDDGKVKVIEFPLRPPRMVHTPWSASPCRPSFFG